MATGAKGAKAAPVATSNATRLIEAAQLKLAEHVKQFDENSAARGQCLQISDDLFNALSELDK